MGIHPAMYQKALEFEKAFVDAGGLLAAGVDPTGYGAALPGLGDQRNFELLLEAGFTPEQVVQIMSANGAKVLGIYEEVGSIEPGKIADLAVIRGNPASDGNIRNVVMVFKHGVGWDSEKLYDSVRGVVGIQ
jgi:imidazolonepropionase-like amidohydrolase